MPLIASNNQKEFIPLEAGNHIGRVCGLIHIGTITDNIQGKEVTRNRVFISFEIPGQLRDDGKPQTIGQEFTLSMHRQGNLLPFVESMLGAKLSAEETKAFDVYTLVGKPAMVNVIHSEPNAEGVVYANIKGVSPLPKGMECPAAILEPYLFDYTDNFNPEFVWDMNEKTGLYKKITRSEEWLAKGLTRPSLDNM